MTDTERKVARVQELMRAGESQREACRHAGIPHPTYRYHAKKQGMSGAPPTAAGEPAGFERGDDGSAVAFSSPTKGRVPTKEDVLEEHGEEPEDWEVVSIRASRWGSPDDPQFQLRVNAVRKDSLIQIRQVDLGGLVLPEFDDTDFSHGSVAFIGDQHIPYMDPAWERAVLRYLRAEEPSLIVLLGDVGDYSVISRHRTHPRFAAAVNETNDAATMHLSRIRLAAPHARIVLLPGNHDARIDYALADYKPELYGVRPGRVAGTDDIPALSCRRLWNLDSLGIELIEEDWKLAQFRVAPELSARHGYLTGNNSERKLLEKHGRSQVHGHDHRGSVTYRTKHDPLDIRVAMSCGTGAQVQPDGLGYEPDPDWTPGIGVGHVWDDGLFVLNFAPFVANQLLLPGGVRHSGEEDS